MIDRTSFNKNKKMSSFKNTESISENIFNMSQQNFRTLEMQIQDFNGFKSGGVTSKISHSNHME
jgi:hypothetical protein